MTERQGVVLDAGAATARTVGRMLGHTRTADAIDAHIVLLARERGWPAISSDASDLHAIDPSLVVQSI